MASGDRKRTLGEKLMKTSYLILVALAVVLAAPLAKADAFDDANSAFASGDYAKASAAFQTVIDQNGYSAPVLFDLGNAFYRRGDFPRAILAYKRAQWLAPRDPDITANLRAAQKQAGLPPSHDWKGDVVFGLLSPSSWAWIACGAWTLTCIGLLARRFARQQRVFVSLFASATALVLVIAIAAEVVSAPTLRSAVVVDKTTALISPFPAAQVVFTPTPGETVAVQETYHDFLRVKDSSGHIGWIKRAQMEPIIPPLSKG
jgi:hypothetical protein